MSTATAPRPASESPVERSQGVRDVLASVGHTVEFLRHAGRFGGVQGYLHEIEGYALFALAARGPGEGAIVEIGSFMGRSTCWLAAGTQSASREKVVAVDHFTGSPEHQPGASHAVKEIADEGTTYRRFQENVRAAGLEEWVEARRAGSLEAVKNWKGPIRLLFIDGDHSYEASRADFDAWTPHLVSGGVVALHDVGAWEGVTRFFGEVASGKHGEGRYREVMGVNSLRVLERVG